MLRMLPAQSFIHAKHNQHTWPAPDQWAPLYLLFTFFLLCCRLKRPCTVTFDLQTICSSFLHFFQVNSQLLFLTQHNFLVRCSLLPLHLFFLLLGSLFSLLFLHVPKEAQVLLRVRDLGQRQLEDLFRFRGQVQEGEGGETEWPGASRQAELMVIKAAISHLRLFGETGFCTSDGTGRLPSTWRWRWLSRGTHRKKLKKGDSEYLYDQYFYFSSECEYFCLLRLTDIMFITVSTHHTQLPADAPARLARRTFLQWLCRLTRSCIPTAQSKCLQREQPEPSLRSIQRHKSADNVM